MKTNTFNYFRNAFAIVGFFIIACSVGTAEDDSPDDIAPIAQSNNGKYQISSYRDNVLAVLNTSNGVIKSYGYTAGNNTWNEGLTLTVNH
jgi:hypothetical protein